MSEKSENIDLSSELRSAYLDYSMSVIVGRAIPDIRDGLKPVHRRILFAMHELNNRHNQPYKKSARVIGDTIGKFHPHGDGAAYGALVHLAQDFSTNHPLVDGQGNFGSLDGDAFAAMRYTEVRLSKIAESLLEDLEKDTIDWNPNYDDSLKEPSVLPAKFPNLLVNGSSGIAVGMATSILPHNLGEIVEATIKLIKNEDISDKKLYEIIKGPDFPTGGIIVDSQDSLIETMKAGRGSITICPNIHVEKNEKSHRDVLVITSVPYQSNKAKIVEKIAEAVKNKKIKEIHELRDESGNEGVRIVIELKHGVSSDDVIESLLKYTPIQGSVSINNLAIVNGVPKVLSVRQMLSEFIKFRREVIIKRTKFDLNKNEAHAHILEGLIKASKNIDEVIKIIRTCTKDEGPKEELMNELMLSDKQAQAILDMKLARLTKFEYKKLSSELDAVKEVIKGLKKIIEDDNERDNVIIEELKGILKNFSRERITKIANGE